MKDLLAKPNQLIEVEGNLNMTQLKTYNVILSDIHRNIQNERKKGTITEETVKEKYILSYKDIKSRSGILAKDDKKLRKNIENIAKMNITITDKKRGDWTVTSLLSEVNYTSSVDQLEVYLPNSIRKALYYSNYYTTLDLLLMKSFKSKYSVVLYELLKKYEGINMPTYSIEEFSKIFQTKYKRYNDIKKNILDVAIPEVAKYAKYSIECKPIKIGKKISHINLKSKKINWDFDSEILEIKDTDKRLENRDINKINEAIAKAKKNEYVSKIWNKRVDNKINKILHDEGEEYAIKLLNQLYLDLTVEIKTTLVQHLNGMMKKVENNKEKLVKNIIKTNETKDIEVLEEKIEVLKAESESSGIEGFSEGQIEEAINKCVESEEGITKEYLTSMKRHSEGFFMTTIRKYL